MTYKTIVIGYTPKAKERAAAIESTANERAQEGWELIVVDEGLEEALILPAGGRLIFPTCLYTPADHLFFLGG